MQPHTCTYMNRRPCTPLPSSLLTVLPDPPGSASPSSSEDVTTPSQHILPTVLVLSLLLLIIALLAWYFLR